MLLWSFAIDKSRQSAIERGIFSGGDIHEFSFRIHDGLCGESLYAIGGDEFSAAWLGVEEIDPWELIFSDGIAPCLHGVVAGHTHHYDLVAIFLICLFKGRYAAYAPHAP